MAAIIAHEINNPLEAILNLIYLARSNASDPEQVSAFLNTAESELVRLSHIAKQALGFYRENTGAVSFPLEESVSHAIRIYTSKLSAAGVVIKTQLESNRQIMMKKGELMQVISNLIANAGYAMPDGGTLTIVLKDAVIDDRNGLLLTLEDNGCGIPPENLKKIFEPFFTTRSSIGTGIGLWVAKQFIENHAGKIEVQSSTDAVSHGTKVSIFLPLENRYSTNPVS
jgi:signal transduction histidine kinase